MVAPATVAQQVLVSAKVRPVDPMQVIAAPRRRAILRLVWDAERSAGDIASHFDVTFGAVSHHLGVLERAGLVSVRRDGHHRFYRARRNALGPLAAALEQMWAAELDSLATLAEATLAEAAERRQDDGA